MNTVYYLNMIYEVAGSTSTPRSRRRERTFDAILDAGLALVADGGLDALTIGRLAERVDLTPGALYRYVSGKDALVAALNARVLNGWSAQLDQAAARVQADDGALVRALLPAHLYVRVAHDQPAHFALVAITLAEPRVLVADPADAVHIPALRALLARFAVGLAGAVPDVGPAHAVTLMLGITGVLQARKLARFDAQLFDAQALAHALIATQLIGLGADAAVVRRAQARVESILA